MKQRHSADTLANIHERRLEVDEAMPVRPDSLTQVYLHSAEDAGEETHKYGGEKDIALGVLHIF